MYTLRLTWSRRELGGAGFLPAEHADVTERNQESCSPCEGSCFTLSSMEVLKQWPDSSRQKAGRAFGSCSCSISELCTMRVAPCSSERLFNAGVRSWVHTWKTLPELPSVSMPARPCLQNASALSPDDVIFQIPSFPISRLVEWHKTHPSFACLKYLVGRLCSIHRCNHSLDTHTQHKKRRGSGLHGPRRVPEPPPGDAGRLP